MDVDEFKEAVDSDFFTGVPDSLLSVFCDSLIRQYGNDPSHHVIAANEGNAVAIAAGYYLSTGKVPVVYMQNSGEGNSVNPICSLLHPDVYGIPCLFIVGWRGEPGKKDEPQHKFQGKITHQQLDLIDIESFTITDETSVSDLESTLLYFKSLFNQGKSAAIIVSKDALTSKEPRLKFDNHFSLLREKAIETIIENIPSDTVIISTTGKTSRELFELREKNSINSQVSLYHKNSSELDKKESHSHDFLTVGSMGHASSIALGIALQNSQKKIMCIDGDGAVLMHMGALATIGHSRVNNFVHIVVDNCAHESVGGFPTCAPSVDFSEIAKTCGYKQAWTVDNEADLSNVIRSIYFDKKKSDQRGAYFVLVQCAQGARQNLGRPTISAKENKLNFMKMLRGIGEQSCAGS